MAKVDSYGTKNNMATSSEFESTQEKAGRQVVCLLEKRSKTYMFARWMYNNTDYMFSRVLSFKTY